MKAPSTNKSASKTTKSTLEEKEDWLRQQQTSITRISSRKNKYSLTVRFSRRKEKILKSFSYAIH